MVSALRTAWEVLYCAYAQNKSCNVWDESMRLGTDGKRRCLHGIISGKPCSREVRCPCCRPPLAAEAWLGSRHGTALLAPAQLCFTRIWGTAEPTSILSPASCSVPARCRRPKTPKTGRPVGRQERGVELLMQSGLRRRRKSILHLPAANVPVVAQRHLSHPSPVHFSGKPKKSQLPLEMGLRHTLCDVLIAQCTYTANYTMRD